MKNRNIGLYLIIFAVLYFIFTVFIVSHGVHFTNSFFAIAIFLGGLYYYIKKER